MKRKKYTLADISNFIRNIKKIITIIIKSSPTISISFILINFIAGFIVPIQLLVWKNFIDSSSVAISSGIYGNSIRWILLVCLLTIINRFISRASYELQKLLVDYLNKYITKMVTDKLSELDMSSFDDPEIYDIIERVNQESVGRSFSILTMLSSLLRNIVVLIGAMTIMLSFNPIIVVLSCLSTIPLFFASLSISLKQYKIYVDRLQKLRLVDYIKNINIKYENIKELKIYRAIPFLKDKMLNTYDKYLEDDKKIRKNYLRKLTRTDIVQNISSSLLKIYILINVIKNKHSVGELSMYISSLDNLESSIKMVLDSIASLYTDNLYIDNLLFLMKLEPRLKDDGENYFNGKFEKIEFHNVSFKYPHTDKYILRNINLIIESNKVYALVGLNGSGKTTIVKLLLRLYEPNEGKILIDDISIQNFKIDSLYENMGVVFQDFIKYPLSAYENIGIGNIGLMHDKNKVKAASCKSGADSFIQKLPYQYETILQKEWEKGTELSLGQWQKVAISRAFVANASILILDEPSASLDPTSEHEMFHHFKQMMPNKTCLLITHRFSNVILADKIFVLENGSIVESGSHKNLLERNGVYKKLFSMQANSYVNHEKH